MRRERNMKGPLLLMLAARERTAGVPMDAVRENMERNRRKTMAELRLMVKAR